MATWSGNVGFSNFNELYANVGVATSDILKDCMEKYALPKLLDYIQKDVYSYPATWTNGNKKNGQGRTGEFGDEDTWFVGEIKSGFYNQIYIALDGNSLHYGSPFSHNYLSMTNRIEDALPEIINNGLGGSYMNFPAIKARPFWYDFMNWFENKFGDIFVKECKRNGINMTITGGISAYI